MPNLKRYYGTLSAYQIRPKSQLLVSGGSHKFKFLFLKLQMVSSKPEHENLKQLTTQNFFS